jgi:glycyl-tRNA synthetase
MAQRVSTVDTVVSLCKRRGFVFPCGEIYGGTRSAWDYGPLGVELKENIKRQWWKAMVHAREDVVGLDSSIILPRQVWVASGHVGTFTDPLVECLSCHKRERADHLQEAYAAKKGTAAAPMTPRRRADVGRPCPHCGNRGQWTEPRDFNMMLKTYLGVVEDESGLHYLRPETAQGIFVNFKNVEGAARKKPPFGIAQTGKSFRNEITPGNFIFRTREFEQMEMEFFVVPGTDEEWHQYWIDERTRWYVDLGIKADNLRHYEHPKEKLSHYSKRTVDIEYRFNFTGSEWGELEGIANRTDFDLTSHGEHSGQDLSYFDQATGERYVPYVIEPAAGLSRSLMTFLVDAYAEDEAPNTKGGVDKRIVLRLDPRLAPVKAAVLPLSRNADLSPEGPRPRRHAAAQLECRLRRRRCHRQALSPPGRDRHALLHHRRLRHPEDQAVTIRERDSMAQERVGIDQGWLAQRLVGLARSAAWGSGQPPHRLLKFWRCPVGPPDRWQPSVHRVEPA